MRTPGAGILGEVGPKKIQTGAVLQTSEVAGG